MISQNQNRRHTAGRKYAPRSAPSRVSGSAAMHCPFCGGTETGVLDSRFHTPQLFRRRRECTSCHQRFTTAEVVALHLEEATAQVTAAVEDLRTPLARKLLRVQIALDALLVEVESEP